MVRRAAGSTIYRGEAGRKKAEEELERQKERQAARREQGNMPFRFRMRPGETTQFIVLDDAPDFYRFEHNMKNPATGIWDTYTGCVNEVDNCPVCAKLGADPYYAMYLTVIDLTPFTDKQGKTHEFSRKLLVVKPAQQKKFHRAYAKAEAEGGTLRGALFETTRDGDKDSAIGNDMEVLEFLEEEELATYVRSWKDREGKKHTEDCSEPFDYDKLFPEATAEELRAVVGGEPPLGNRAEEERSLRRRGRAVEEDDDDDEDYEKPALAKRRGVPARKAEEEEDTPARGRARRGATPSTMRRGREEAEEYDEDAVIDEDDDEAAPPRTPRRGARETPSAGRVPGKRVVARGRR